MRIAVEEQDGIKIQGQRISNLRYADDTMLLEKSEEDLQKLLSRVARVSKDRGLQLNVKKTKVMAAGKTKTNLNIKVNNEKVEQVENYTYLGANISEDGESRTEIRTRLAIARTSLVKLNNIWSNRGISSNTKKRLLKALIWPIATYGCETWTLNKIEENKLNVFEMWTFRRILRISCRAHKTNDWILQAVNERRTFLTAVKRQKLKYFGHIGRSEGLENIILEGKIEGKRSRGRQRTKWSDKSVRSCVFFLYTQQFRLIALEWALRALPPASIVPESQMLA